MLQAVEGLKEQDGPLSAQERVWTLSGPTHTVEDHNLRDRGRTVAEKVLMSSQYAQDDFLSRLSE